MTEIYCMTQIHKYWNETICLAEKCSWKAGPYLAQKMKSNDFNTWERVFVACVMEKWQDFAHWLKRMSCQKNIRLHHL